MARKHNDNSNISTILNNYSEKVGTDKCSYIHGAVDPLILFIEPFYSGSHKQLIDLLHKNFQPSTLVTLSGKKWPWRARCSALIISTLIPPLTTEKVLFCSSVLSLAELLGLRPDLQGLNKIVYFHENQFVYPVRIIKDRDIQYAYNQITTCLAADKILFNSEFNYSSFVDNFNKVIKLLPDYRPKGLLDKIRQKCNVLYYPVEYPILSQRTKEDKDYLEIVWPHRWEFDKSPEVFIDILMKLKNAGCNFKVHMLGAGFTDIPDTIKEAQEKLKNNFLTFGYVEDKNLYYKILESCDVVVSTAIHEFFGVSMLEATYCGCLPIAPNRLAYKEIYPKNCLYKDDDECYEMLKKYCVAPNLARTCRKNLILDFSKYSSANLIVKYREFLNK